MFNFWLDVRTKQHFLFSICISGQYCILKFLEILILYFYFRTAIQDDEMEQTWFDVVWKTTPYQANFQVIFFISIIISMLDLANNSVGNYSELLFQKQEVIIRFSSAKEKQTLMLALLGQLTKLIFFEESQSIRLSIFSWYHFSLTNKYNFFVKVKETEQWYIFFDKFETEMLSFLLHII